MTREAYSTSTKASGDRLVPWLAAEGPLAYTPELPPERDSFRLGFTPSRLGRTAPRVGANRCIVKTTDGADGGAVHGRSMSCPPASSSSAASTRPSLAPTTTRLCRLPRRPPSSSAASLAILPSREPYETKRLPGATQVRTSSLGEPSHQVLCARHCSRWAAARSACPRVCPLSQGSVAAAVVTAAAYPAL